MPPGKSPRVGIIARTYDSKGSGSKKMSCTIKLKLPCGAAVGWDSWGIVSVSSSLEILAAAGRLASQECCLEIYGRDLGVTAK